MKRCVQKLFLNGGPIPHLLTPSLDLRNRAGPKLFISLWIAVFFFSIFISNSRFRMPNISYAAQILFSYLVKPPKKLKGMHWYSLCRSCQHPPCYNCKRSVVKAQDIWSPKDAHSRPYCSPTCEYPPCAYGRCKERRPIGRNYSFHNIPQWFCSSHKQRRRGAARACKL